MPDTKLNQDGLEAGQLVDYATWAKVSNKIRTAKPEEPKKTVVRKKTSEPTKGGDL